jgi:hypothetical protein
MDGDGSIDKVSGGVPHKPCIRITRWTSFALAILLRTKNGRYQEYDGAQGKRREEKRREDDDKSSRCYLS